MSEISHQQPGSQIFENLRHVMEERTPLFYATPYVGPHKDVIAMHDMSAPLARDGHTVDMMFVVVDFTKKQTT